MIFGIYKFKSINLKLIDKYFIYWALILATIFYIWINIFISFIFSIVLNYSPNSCLIHTSINCKNGGKEGNRPKIK